MIRGVQEEFEDTKGVIRIRKSKRTDNIMTKRKRTLGQTTIYKTLYKTKDRVTRTPLKTEGEFRCSGRVSSSSSTSGTRRASV
jgi:hypothetical protein